jgi:hypothetical protein
MTKRKKKRKPLTELDKLRAALFKSDIFAYRRFGARKYTLCKYFAARGPGVTSETHAVGVACDRDGTVAKFPSEVLALRHAMLRKEDFGWGGS